MPLATVRYDGKIISRNELTQLGFVFPSVVAEALSCNVPPDKEGNVTPEEVEIRFERIGDLDVNTKSVCIEIIANDYPARRARLAMMTAALSLAIRRFIEKEWRHITPLDYYIWVRLQVAAFEEGKAR